VSPFAAYTEKPMARLRNVNLFVEKRAEDVMTARGFIVDTFAKKPEDSHQWHIIYLTPAMREWMGKRYWGLKWLGYDPEPLRTYTDQEMKKGEYLVNANLQFH
jgi:hypothetical protein